MYYVNKLIKAASARSYHGRPFRTIAEVRMSDRLRLMHSTSACRAFVGSQASPAEEYHDHDFSWEDHKAEVERRRLHSTVDKSLLHSRQPGKHSQPTLQAESWERFHAKENASAKFYKERRYLLLEFPQLAVLDPPQHIVEIGCGCGSSLMPVLKANPACRVSATDLSPTAVKLFQRAAHSAGIPAERIHAFAFDSAQDGPKNLLRGLEADAVLLIFTLAALSPQQMPVMLRHAFQALRSGGMLFIRDHGLYDLTHLRLSSQQQIGHRLYQRQDGTICYFFTVEDLQAKVEAAGFETVECKYACVSLKNRKRDLEMRRIFVHGVFWRP